MKVEKINAVPNDLRKKQKNIEVERILSQERRDDDDFRTQLFRNRKT